MRVGLIGCGAIGQALLACLAQHRAAVEVVGVLVLHPEKHRAVPCPVVATAEALLACGPDLVVECARQGAVGALGPKVLGAGCDLVVASAGALADEAVYAALLAAANRGGARVRVPSGALVGIDALAAAKEVGLAEVCYQRRSPHTTWLRSGAIDAETAARGACFEVFRGSAREAALRYPKNANVAATIALAGVGFDATRVVLIADPSASANTHSIEARGEFGQFRAEITARTLSPNTTSSRIVAGSLARAVLGSAAPIVA